MDRAPLPAARGAAAALTLASLLLVLSTGVQAFSAPVADNDLWGHLYFGQEILRNGLPERNLYSYTAPGHPWINHEILAESAFAWAYERFGAVGLVGLKVAIGLSTLGIMLSSARLRTREPLAWGAALLIAASLMSRGYLIRPQIFSFLALALVWHLLQRYAVNERRGLWLLPAVVALWINTHGGVLAGFGIVVLFAILFPLGSVPSAARAGRGWTEGDGPRLAALAAACSAALLINPYGVDLLIFLLKDVLVTRPITEWAPIPPLDPSNLPFKLATVIFVVAAAARRARPLWEVIIVGLGAIATFRHERHLPLFAILLAPFLAESLALALEWSRRRIGLAGLSTGSTLAVAAGAVLVAGMQLAATLRLHRSLEFGILVPPDLFPVQAVRFIRENELRGNLALPFDWGEYAIWHLYPDCRVSVDGRYTTAYPDRVIDASWRYLEGSDGWDDVLGGARLALADRRHPTAVRLASEAGWREIYRDETAVLFAREDVRLPGSLDPSPPLLVREAILFP